MNCQAVWPTSIGTCGYFPPYERSFYPDNVSWHVFCLYRRYVFCRHTNLILSNYFDTTSFKMVLSEGSILTFSTWRLFGPHTSADAVLSTPLMMLWRLFYEACGAQRRADCTLRSLCEEVLIKHKSRPAVTSIHNKCPRTINTRRFDIFVPWVREGVLAALCGRSTGGRLRFNHEDQSCCCDNYRQIQFVNAH